MMKVPCRQILQPSRMDKINKNKHFKKMSRDMKYKSRKFSKKNAPPLKVSWKSTGKTNKLPEGARNAGWGILTNNDIGHNIMIKNGYESVHINKLTNKIKIKKDLRNPIVNQINLRETQSNSEDNDIENLNLENKISAPKQGIYNTWHFFTKSSTAFQNPQSSSRTDKRYVNNYFTDNKSSEKKLAEKKIAAKKLAAKKLADTKLADKKIAINRLADRKIADKKITEKIAGKILADKKLADKILTNKKYADKHLVAKNSSGKKCVYESLERNKRNRSKTWNTSQQRNLHEPSFSGKKSNESIHKGHKIKHFKRRKSSCMHGSKKSQPLSNESLNVYNVTNNNKYNKLKFWNLMRKKNTGPISIEDNEEKAEDDGDDDDSYEYKESGLLKRKLRSSVWKLSKNAIKRNAYWNELLRENNINIDRINAEKANLSLIDVDALGIENKLLKRTVTWLLK